MSPTTEEPAADGGAAELRLAIEESSSAPSRATTRTASRRPRASTSSRARRYWRALGFADAEPGEAPYTDTDVAALQRAVDLVEHGGIDEQYVLALTRAMGQTMARLADWQVDIAVDRLQSEGRPLEAGRGPGRLEASLPDLEHLLTHAWRRHLLAAVGRVLDAEQDGLAAASSDRRLRRPGRTLPAWRVASTRTSSGSSSSGSRAGPPRSSSPWAVGW